MGKPEILDSFERNFSSYEEMHNFHREEAENSEWRKVKISDLFAFPLNTEDSEFLCDSSVSDEAIEDAERNTGIAIKATLLPVFEGEGFFQTQVKAGREINIPLRDSALRGLFERAKISGLSLHLLAKADLCQFLNKCFALYSGCEALILIRDEKITACHSGDCYSILPVDELLEVLVNGLTTKFGRVVFKEGYSSHSFVTAKFELVDAKKSLLSSYEQQLKKARPHTNIDDLVPAITFNTSDTGVSCARCSAYLAGDGYSIVVGSALEVEHKGKASVIGFGDKVDQMFAHFSKTLSKLEKLLDVYIQHPISCMERICKHLKLPKKYSLEAVSMFESANGDEPCTAHDIYLAMQEVLFLYRTSSEGKVSQLTLFNYEENIARALSLNWSNFDLAKRIEW